MLFWFLSLAMALSVRASVRGQREKPGPRSPACRGSAYPAPRDSLALPASSGKRLLPRDTYDSVAVALARPPHDSEPIRHRVLKPDELLAPLVGLGLKPHRAERQRPGDSLERLGGDGDADHSGLAATQRS